ncbi:DUF1285 domain-containing protein [Croceicoccus naphthovorans]|uniref:Proteophosphoglycan-like protein n=1 Tax=Croceicoccus naphthovorans TaxID=1348774 RepID=A0A0G3XF87_9SPHN|nr:DUF1285 domain-containing protein [Croceicoccus naphthovorans]AKM10185.1 proteophosphoglycan precursor-like protein [Croceicoccus naphthovorans]MBB3990577.1 hypothetical protein [Croceicoccus naphthovorans]
MPYEVPPDLAGMTLAEVAEAVAARTLPPVSQWNPDNVGESGMRIARDGRWYHDDSEITRPAMVRAFSGLLRRDGNEYWLVVPYQKLSIAVDDAPFIATDVRRDECGGKPVLTFRLNTDEFVTADTDHPITARGDAQTPAIYVTVRDGLEARLDRSTYTQLAEIAIAEGAEPLSVTSNGATFALVPSVA